MKTILEQLYLGEYYPAEALCVEDEEYHRLQQRIGEELRYWEARLSKEEFKRFDELEGMFAAAGEFEQRESFRQGAALGISLLLEIQKLEQTRLRE